MNHKLEMLMNGFENEKLFAKEVPVSVKNAYTNQTRKTRLFLTMEWKEASMYNRKVLKITLTDDDDIYFLYNLELSEEEFHILKTNQDLLINFPSFPQHIIDYIEKCFHEEHDPQHKFSLVFTYSDKCGPVAAPPQLDIIETSQFKNLTHLSLKFTGATEIVLKQHQSALFKHLKEANKQLQKNFDYMEKDLKSKLTTCQQTLNCKIEEMELVRKELNVELSMKESNHQRELQEEKERLISRHKDEMDRLMKEIKMKEYNFHKDIQQFESRVNVLDTLNKELQDKNFKYESIIRELKSKVQHFEDEINHLKESLQNYKHKYDHLQSEFNEKQRCIEDQEEKLRDLRQKLSSKEQSILKLKDRIESEIEQKKLIENKFEDIKFRLDMCEKQRKALEVDKEKLNDVIVGLQDKIKEVKNEEKTLSHNIAKHKKTIDEKERALLDVKQEMAELSIALQTKSAEVQNVVDLNRNLHAKIEDLKKELRDSENMRKYMHRQMTEGGVIPTYTPPSHLISPTTIAEKELHKISSQRSKNSPPVLTEKSAASKTVRIETASPVHKQRNSFPPHSHRGTGTDSAYCTASSHSNQNTPEILAGNYKMNCNPLNFEVDPEVLNGAFGDIGHNLKHSTAKKPLKPSKPVNSSTPKSSKKR